MTKRVLVVGQGELARHLAHLLKQDSYEVVKLQSVPDDPDREIDIAVVASDNWDPSLHFDAEISFRESDIPWLRGFIALGEGIIGPLVLPASAGCSQCADTRRFMADADRIQMWQLKSYLMADAEEDLRRDAWASEAAVIHMAQLLRSEVFRFFAKNSRPLLLNHMMFVQLQTLTTSRHAFLPDAKCSVCGGLEVDSQETAKIVLTSTPKIRNDSYRTRSIAELKDVLAVDYLDGKSGLLNAKVRDLIAPYAATGVNLPLLVGDEGSSGRSHSYPESELTAILEGLERYCGIEPRGRTGFITDTYANLQDKALNPAAVGLHAPEQYESAGFPFQAFAADTPMQWVWGYSLTRSEPILVPKLLAYYSLGYNPGFVYETSNGCAIGGSLVEAVFHGILEVVERDAFLLTWYARLPLPPLFVDTLPDTELHLMLHRLKTVTGYEVHFFNATMENGIPSIFAIAKNRRARGLNLMCAAGSHPDAVTAVKSAVHEIAGMLLRFDDKLEHHKQAYLQMLYDSRLVQEMDQHSMLYGLPEAEERLSFLFNTTGKPQSFVDAFPTQSSNHSDLADDLRELLDVFKNLNLNVIVVNQTSSEIERNDLYCVKVLIPGMLPMTFGHDLKRIEGLERLLNVPMRLGYTDKPLTKAELNPYPHPFP